MMYLTDISILGGFLFQRSTCNHTLDWYHHYFRRLLKVIQYFQGYCVSHFFYYIFLNKLTIFHYNKIKLRQKDINTKRYTRLKFKLRLQSVKIQKNKTKRNKQKKTLIEAYTKQNKTKDKREREREREKKNLPSPFFRMIFYMQFTCFLIKIS